MFASLSDKKLHRIAECRRYTIKINLRNSKTSKKDIEAAEQVKTQGILGLFIVIMQQNIKKDSQILSFNQKSQNFHQKCYFKVIKTNGNQLKASNTLKSTSVQCQQDLSLENSYNNL